MIFVAVKLALAGTRSRLLPTILMLLIAAAAAATIVAALEVRATGVDPWNRTFDTAHGAHVLANVASNEDALAVASLPDVAERDAPIPTVRSTIQVDGQEMYLFLAGLDGQPKIDAPLLTAGTEPQEGEIVLEGSFADALNLGVGSTLEVLSVKGTLQLTIVGAAISPSQSRFPRQNPGLAWVTRSTFEQIAPDPGKWRWTQAIRLSDSEMAADFTGRAAAVVPAGTASFATWQQQRDDALKDSQPTTVIFTVYTLLLIIVMYSVVTILVGARTARQHREIGLLKAIGFTPRQIGAIFAVESAGVGLVAVGIGFAIGALIAPRLAAPSAETLLGAPTVAANPWHYLIAATAIIPVLLIGTLVAASRGTRQSTLQAMRADTHVVAPHSLAARLVERIRPPLPIGVGLKDLLARRSRALWMASAIVVTATAIVITLMVQAALNSRPSGEISDIPSELPALIYTLDAVLLLITGTTLLTVTLVSVRERVRDFGIMKTLGFTPTAIAASLVGAHGVLAVIASIVSIPIGFGLYLGAYQLATSAGDETTAIAPWWWLASVPLVLPIIAVLVASIPARIASQISAADAVRYE